MPSLGVLILTILKGAFLFVTLQTNPWRRQKTLKISPPPPTLIAESCVENGSETIFMSGSGVIWEGRSQRALNVGGRDEMQTT